jgi:hypothetical protein
VFAKGFKNDSFKEEASPAEDLKGALYVLRARLIGVVTKVKPKPKKKNMKKQILFFRT